MCNVLYAAALMYSLRYITASLDPFVQMHYGMVSMTNDEQLFIIPYKFIQDTANVDRLARRIAVFIFHTVVSRG